MRRDQRGFALVESLATMSFAAAAMTGGVGLTYTAYAHMFLKRAAYEFSVCLMTPEIALVCQKKFESEVAHALPVGKLDHVVPSRYRTSVAVHARFTAPGGVKIAVEDDRKIPQATEASPEELKRRFP